MKIEKIEKLVGNLHDKTKYIQKVENNNKFYFQKVKAFPLCHLQY